MADNAVDAAIRVVKGDVAATVADAVVNAANEHLRVGSGICGAIFRRAGLAQLQAACDKVAPCPTGEARVTPAFGITNAKFVIHAVGPRYADGRHGEPEKLASCVQIPGVSWLEGVRCLIVPETRSKREYLLQSANAISASFRAVASTDCPSTSMMRSANFS